MNRLVRGLIAALPLILVCAGCATGATLAARTDFAQVVPGKTKEEVRAMLGAPARTYPARGAQAESWEYPYRGDFEKRSFWVDFGPGGTVSGTNDTKDFSAGYYRGP